MKNNKIILTSAQEALLQKCGTHYNRECFAYWTNPDGSIKHDDYTGDDEYANGCFGSANQYCPICQKK